MRIVTIITLVLFTGSFPAGAQTPCNINDHYKDFISLEKGNYQGNTYLISGVEKTKRPSCYSRLVNNNTRFLNYLLTNFSTPPDEEVLLALKDSVAMQTAYVEQLQKDSSFNAVMKELGQKTIDKSLAKDSVSIDKLLNTAVKFFSIIRLNEEEDYVLKVCTGINGLKETEAHRQPFLEAFCLSAILKHYQSNEFNLYKEVEAAVLDIYKVNLGIDKKDRLLRAQGALFLLMRKNQVLQAMLKKEYQLQKEYLPFILKVG